MGFTQKLGLLAQGVYSDSSLNVGIGGAPSGSYKFETTGTAKISSTLLVSGVATFGSTLSNGTYTYTLPSATGTLALVGGAGVGTVTSVAAITLGTTGSDLSSTVANGTTTPVITLQVPTASAANRGALSSADWSTFNGKQGTITLTTTGTSGAATFSANTLNIPNYADGGVLSLSAIGGTANANAATITGTVLNLQPADASFGGVVTTGTQTFAGAKTLTGALSGTSATFSGLITSTAASDILTATSSNTSYKWINLANTGGNLVVGINTSAGGATMSTSAYASYIFTRNATDLVFGTNEVARLTIASTGAATFSSSVTATAFIPSGATVPTNGMYLSAANTLNFATNTTNRLSIASTGAATFSGNLSCSGASIQLNQTELIASTGASNRAYAFNIGNVAAGDFTISQGSTATGGTYTTRLTINPTGYVGIGVTPNAWYTSGGYKVLQIAAGLSLDSGNDFRARLAANAYVNTSGDWVYANTGFASNYNQSSGTHVWETAPSGVAGNAITFTERLSIAQTGAATFSSSITTGAPSGGTAKPFKVGAVSETGPAIINKVMVEIDSVVYYIPLSAAVV